MRLDRLKENELSKVEEHFGEHPLFTSCKRAFKRYQANMAPLLFTYGEVFYEAAIIIDQIHKLPQTKEVQTYIADLWNDLRFKLSKWEKTATQENLDMAVSAVLYTVAMAMNRHWTTFYFSDVTRWLLQCIKDNMKVDYQEMTHVFSVFLDASDGIEEWINNCYDNGQRMSDEIEKCLRRKTPDKQEQKVKPAGVITTSFYYHPKGLENSSINTRLQEVYNLMVKDGVELIPITTNMRDFLKVFSGEDTTIRIAWIGRDNELHYILSEWVRRGYLPKPRGGLWKVTAARFYNKKRDKDGVWIEVDYTPNQLRQAGNPKNPSADLESIIEMLKPDERVRHYRT